MATLPWFPLQARYVARRQNKMFAKGSSQDTTQLTCRLSLYRRAMTQLTCCLSLYRRAKGMQGASTPKTKRTSGGEIKHRLHTGYRSLNQGLALSVPILSVDTDHILHGGLQAFNGHFCLICRGRRSSCRSTQPPKPLPREKLNQKQTYTIIMKYLFLLGKSDAYLLVGKPVHW